MRVRGLKKVGVSRIVEDRIKKTLKTKHPLRREAPRLHSYEDPPESPGLWVKDEQDGKKGLVLSIVAANNLHLEQLDVRKAFLHGNLDEDIYMTQPEGYKRCVMDHCCYFKTLAEDGKIKIDKFDGHDFGFWKKQIEDYMYQKKLYKPLAKAKCTDIKAEEWALLDRQALGAVRLSLAKNIAYNVVNEKTTYGLLKALSNMYEKPNDVNEFNSILSRLMSVDIKLDDEVQALFCYSLHSPESWSGTVKTVSGLIESTKLKFDNIHDLILGEDIHRKASREYSNYLLSAEDKGRGRKQYIGQKPNRSRSKSKKRCQSKNRDKAVNMPAGDYDDALVCCVENTIDDCIMDSGASFHATYCKEELERFRLRFGKVRLADDKTLNIAGIKKRLISVRQLDKEGYHVGFRRLLKGNAALWHQRLGHMSEKGMKILASKGRIPDLQKAVVGFCEPCVLGKQKKVNFVKSGNTRKLQRLKLVHTDVYGLTSVALIDGSRYYVTFIDDCSRKVKDVARDKLDAKSVKCTFIGYGSDEMGYRFWDLKSHKVIRSRDVTFNEDSLYGAKATTDSSNLTKLNQKDQVSLGGSLDVSEGFKNSGSFEDSGRSDEEDSKDKASSKEGGSEAPQLQRSTREFRASVRCSPYANYLLMTENGKPESYSEALSSK
ncbi:retrovirus-related pol polyprotein from transposon TNT 1-94 [Tanacetum coccineum]